MEPHHPVRSRGTARTRAFPIDVGRALLFVAAGLSFVASVYPW